MKNSLAKISLIILIVTIIVSCNTTKRVPDAKRLLMKNEVSVDGKIDKDEEVINQLYQKPNSSILGYRLRLNIYNWAKKDTTDSIFRKRFKDNPKKFKRLEKLLSKKQINRLGHSFWHEGIHKFLRRTGEAPVLLDTLSTKKSLRRLKSYYYNQGYFNVTAKAETDSTGSKKAEVRYIVEKKTPYILDSIRTTIKTPILDSLYTTIKSNSSIKSGKQYNTADIDAERARITQEFRNNGVFYFQPNYVRFNLDTIKTNKKVNVNLIIEDQNIRVNDTNKTQQFRIYKINRVNIFTDQLASKNEIVVNDSTEYNGYHLYSEKKLKYRPKAITDAIFIAPGTIYSDKNTILTSKYISNLKVFNYPLIQYNSDPKDPNGLIANILLSPRDKYTFNYSIDFTHSDIQQFGISGNTSLGIRNVFNGAESFEIGFRGNIGSSKDQANPNNTFFNISEIGIDSKLSFPRILMPFNTRKIIPKEMIPSTSMSVGFAKQTNIGLDKQNFTSALSYNWKPRNNSSIRFDLLNVQFVKNVNPENYFNIYRSSFENLNELAIKYNYNTTNPEDFEDGFLRIEEGVFNFLGDIQSENIVPTTEDLKTIRSIFERRRRLIEDNLIFSTSISYSKTTKKELQDNSFYTFKTKLESAGNILSLIAKLSKQLDTQEGANTFLDVEYSQYLKSEFEYIKHWDLGKKKVFAIRSFFGIAVPYGNSDDIPFSRSYFAGGTNDIRAWQPYSLGPGKSGGILDFNEANMKMSVNAEFRFNIFKSFNGALFADAGNIWNVFDAVEDENYQFRGIKSLETIALGTGFGLRYDFGLFVFRTDLGFKTYNPSIDLEQKWFRELNLSKSVINIGINYPF
ncbi:MAG: BamA/TamA family outer membrane protein [Flavobacteriales bacterium]|nr:BamA/TamA family outer membrane protein [Flavobacteriales bacterium]